MSEYSTFTTDEKQRLLDHARARYMAGATLDELVESLPVSKATLHRAQVRDGWRRKDIEAQAAGDAPLPKPDWMVKYEDELARVPSGMDRDYVNQPDRLGELKAQAEALPESLDITDMKQAAQKAGELAARYQLIGEVKLADAQARLAERFVKLASGLEGLDGVGVPLDPEPEPEDDGEDMEELRDILFRRLETVAGEEYIKEFYAEYVMENGGRELFEKVACEG